MKRIRVLVVDDSVVIRRMLSDVLADDPAIEIAGVAANGSIALAMLEQCSPDAVTLDVEMPGMDGIEVLRKIRESHRTLPVIMFSTLTDRGAAATLDALAAGASDYVAKPANVGSVSAGMERIREDLAGKIKALCGVAMSLPRLAVPAKLQPVRPARAVPFEVVAIGCSTGGPNALADILPQLPGDFPVPVVIVQHMPPTFTRFLAERLNMSCNLAVHEAGMDQPLERGHIWLAPGDFHISVYTSGTRVRLRTHQAPPENSCRPAVDVLFRSIAKTFGPRALAVVLTGMGQDGLRGAETLKEAGGSVIAQDESTSVVWGMPGFVVQAGLADRVVPLPQIAQEITRRVAMHRLAYA